MADKRDDPHVYIVGAGIAGMAAALRLLEKGYRVTVFEASQDIGGKFGAEKDNHGVYHEHAYHIFADWCVNFYGLCKEMGITLEDHFIAFPEFHVLRPISEEEPVDPRMKGRPQEHLRTLDHLGSPEFFWKNVNSRVAEWHEMVLFGCSYLDLLLDQRLEREEFLNRVSVNGYVRSLPYASEMTGLLHQDLLLKVFASPSYEVSARTYQTYLKLTTAVPGSPPPFRSLKGNCRKVFWDPFKAKLAARKYEGRYRCEFGYSLETVELVELDRRRRVSKLKFTNGAKQDVVEGDHVILAIPSDRLGTVVRRSPDLVRISPQLLEVAKLSTVQFAALDLYFTTKLTLPDSTHVTLMDDPAKLSIAGSQEAKNGIASEYGLSFIDNGSFWPPDHWGKHEGRGEHFLSVLVGDFGSLAGFGHKNGSLDRARVARKDDAPGLIVADLQKYIQFDLADVDWSRSYFRNQADTPLFVNSVGSWEYRPETRLTEDDRNARHFKRLEDEIPNLHLAGDFCRSRIDVVSVEAALVTGITAARAICRRVKKALDPLAELPEIDMDRLERGRRLLSGWKDIAAARARSHAS